MCCNNSVVIYFQTFFRDSGSLSFNDFYMQAILIAVHNTCPNLFVLILHDNYTLIFLSMHRLKVFGYLSLKYSAIVLSPV